MALADQWTELLVRIRQDVGSWNLPAAAGWLFGSASREDGGSGSDIDILLITPTRDADEADASWNVQTDRLAERVRAWSDNTCEVLELSSDELLAADQRDDRLVKDLLEDAVPPTGVDVRTWLGRSRGKTTESVRRP